MLSPVFNKIEKVHMNKYIATTCLAFILTTAYANSSSLSQRYTHAQFIFKNTTQHDQLITFYDIEGSWQQPLPDQPIVLKPLGIYKNTLISVKKNHHLENTLSAEVSQLDNARDNYLIFGEETFSQRHEVSAHIFDGLGDMFVDSATNHCDDSAPNGYARCQLIIADQS